MKTIVILISGRGSNMQAIVAAAIANMRIAAVIANVPDAAGLQWAHHQGLKTHVVDHHHFSSRLDFDSALAEVIDLYTPDLIVLAGFMRILSASFTQRYASRVLNIHPSLLPAFSGLNTHQRALDAGCKITGCTVHFVTDQLDHGPIVAQASLAILPNDNAQTLAKRVLALEHQLYPASIRWFIDGRLNLVEGRVTIDQHAQSQECVLFSPHLFSVIRFS